MRNLPGGPASSLLSTIHYARNPDGFFNSCQQKYGDPFTVTNFGGTVVMTGTPELVRTIFTEPSEKYHVYLEDALRPLLGDSSLFVLSGEHHKTTRKLLLPPFHGARMRTYGKTFYEIAAERARSWTRSKPVRMHDETHAISLDIIIHTVFGVTEKARVAVFREAILERMAASKPAIIFFKALRHEFWGMGPWARMQRALRRMDELIHGEIRARRDLSEQREDILSLMMAARYDDGQPMKDEALRDQLLTLLLAGHETTGTALSWALYWLHRHPECFAKLRSELDSLGPTPEPEAITALPYLKAVCHETLRLYPIVPDVVRKLKEPMMLGGHVIPAGVGVGVSVNLVHQREDIYPQPERFVPERFLNKQYSAFEFLPFGGGTRRCLGAAFALYEMQIVLAAILKAHRLRLLDAQPVRPARRHFTTGPETPIEMLIDTPLA